MKKEPIDQPTKAGIAALFRELSEEFRSYEEDPDVKDLVETVDAMETRLLADTQFVKLKKQLNKLRDERNKEKKARLKNICAVRKLYYAKGLTSYVRKRIEELVEGL